MMNELQYVVLYHDAVMEPHYDLMFEVEPGQKLLTFRSPIWPVTKETKLELLGEHRRDYLTYEGPISGARGMVRRVVSGTYEMSGDGSKMRIEFKSGTDHPPITITDSATCVPEA
jgi:hypothetical protein